MNLSKEELQLLMYVIDLVIQNFGNNERLEEIYEKLKETKNNVK